MKYSAVLAAFTAAGLASAQLESVPECARECLTPAISATGCSETDLSCMCKAENREKIVAGGTGCVLQSCGQETAINEVLPAITKLCEGALSESMSSGASSILPGTTMPSVTPTGVPIPPRATGAVSSIQSSASDIVSSASGIITSATASATNAIPTGPSNGTATSTPVPAGAASLSGLGGFAMFALGALAAY